MDSLRNAAILLVVLTPSGWAGTSLDALKSYKFGDSRAGWNSLRSEALKSGADISELLAFLDSEATSQAKEEVCRILALAARPEAIPVLERLAGMPSPKPGDHLNEMALYALASIPGAEADQALASLHSGPAAEAAARELERRSGQPRPEDRKPGPGDLKKLEAALAPGEPFQVRTAALKAIAGLEGARVVPRLALALKDKEGEFRAQAILSLEKIPGEASSRALGTALDAAPGPDKVLILGALGRHGGPGVLPLLRREAGSESPEIRSAAYRALADLGDPSSLDGLARAAAEGSEEARACLTRIHGLGLDEAIQRQVLDSAGKARAELIRAMIRRKQNLNTAFLSEQTESSEDELRTAAFEALAGQGGAEERAAVLQALGSGRPEIHGGALRALAAWPNSLVREDLRGLAKEGAAGPTERIFALRAFIRLAGSDFDLLDQALALSARPEEKRLVLAGMGLAESPEAPARLRTFFNDPSLKEEAQAAALAQADRISGSNPERAQALAREVLALDGPDKLREACEKVLKKVESRIGGVTRWRLSGVYTKEGAGPQDLFNIPFPPETQGGTWAPLEGKGDNPGRISLQEALGPGDNRAAYMEARLISERKIKTVLEAGSDDGIKVWLNDKVVLADNAVRGYKEGQDRVRVTLVKGENRLLVKVTQGSGEWEASVRLHAPDGGGLEGVKVQTP